MGFGNLEIKTNSKFFKIESGHPRDIRLLQDTPMERIIHGFGKEALPCEGNDCSLCAEGQEAKQRFSVNVYDHGLKKVMVWDFGGGVAKEIKKIAISVGEEQRSILDIDLKVEAEGEQKSKKYKITPRMTSKPVPDGLKLLPLEGDLPF